MIGTNGLYKSLLIRYDVSEEFLAEVFHPVKGRVSSDRRCCHLLRRAYWEGFIDGIDDANGRKYQHTRMCCQHIRPFL